MPMFVFIS